jgi:leucyl aminopeptidase (aminopeptidase T)
MRTSTRSAVVTLALVPALALAGSAKAPALAAIAERIISDVAQVKPKEIVLIEADPLDQQMVEELFLAAGKRGASPFVRLTWPKLQRRWLETVPEQHDAAWGAIEDKLIPFADVVVQIARTEDPGFFKDIPAPRMASWNRHFEGLDEKRIKRRQRIINLGNGLFPTRGMAKLNGLTEAELSSLFWAGVGTDYARLHAVGQAVAAAMPAGKTVKVTTPGGTDLVFALVPKSMTVSDGVISEDEQKAGGPALMTWLPAGEAYALISPGSAEGTIVVPRHVVQGQVLTDLVVTVKAGKVVQLTAKPSKAWERFKELYDNAPAGKDVLSIIDLGLNPDVKAPKGKSLRSYVPAGAVTLLLGGDEWAGGSNTVAFGAALFQGDATVSVDGQAVVERGQLKVGPPAK